MIKNSQEVFTATGRRFLVEEGDTFFCQRLAGKGYQIGNLRMFRKLIPNARHILDIGANIGTNTVEYATWAQEVTSFEPTPYTFQWLKENVSWNQKHYDKEKFWYEDKSLQLTAKINLLNKGCGEKAYKAEIVVHNKNCGSNHLRSKNKITNKTKNSIFEVEIIDIDSLNFQNIDGIKMDIEGWELYALYGAEKTIEKYRPIVQTEMSLSHSKRAGYHPQVVCDWFFSRDYIRILRDGRVMPKEFEHVKNMGDSFWVPKEKYNLS